MISVSRLSDPAAAAAYYLDRPTTADYYVAPEEARGTWLGSGALHLGLEGQLDQRGEETFRGLLRGESPDGAVRGRPVLRARSDARVPAAPLLRLLEGAASERLRQLPWWGTYQGLLRQVDRRGLTPVTMRADAVRQMARAAGLDADQIYAGAGIDLGAALALAKERVDVRRPGYDVVFSAPKSVSVLFALTDTDTATAIRQAHATAVEDAMRYLEVFVSRPARGHQAAGQPVSRTTSRGLISAAFEHRASRAGDPQLHTHVVVANLLEGRDDLWNAVDSTSLYRHQHTAGHIYQAVLRGELTRTLGIAWQPVVTGVAELKGVPEHLRRAFSQRRAGIEAFLEEHGLSGPEAARQAALETRPRKSHESEEHQRDRWGREAASIGLTAQLVRGDEPAPDPAKVVAALVSAQGLTQNSSTFDSRDVLQGVCNEIPAGLPVRLDDLLDLGRQVLRDTETVPLLRAASGHDRSYSTGELLRAETEALELAEGTCAWPERPAEDLGTSGLSDEQSEAVAKLVASRRRVTVLEGPAGSGKTAALRGAKAVWSRDGRRVLGGAVAAVAAHGLQLGAGIESMSLARLATEIERHGLENGSVLVIDEASMVGTRSLLALIKAAEVADAQVVLVGDPHQLAEIDAGGMFHTLCERDQTVRLVTNVRQREEWERSALAALRRGHPDDALDEYARHDRVRLADDSADLHARLAADYLRHRSTEGVRDVLILATQRREVAEINARIRGYLRDSGAVGELELVNSEGEGFSEGDEVVVTRNDYARLLFNGTRGRVSRVDDETGLVSIVTREGTEHHLPLTETAGRLSLGYAMTCHKAQGTTVDVALLAGTTALSREAAYVAMSRGRVANYIYVTHTEIQEHDCGMEHGAAEERGHLGPLVGDALARSRRQRTAGSYGFDARTRSSVRSVA